MSRRGIANFAREAQKPTTQDAVHKECVYKEWVTHDFNKVDINCWGEGLGAGYRMKNDISAAGSGGMTQEQKIVGEADRKKAVERHFTTAQQRHFAPPDAYYKV